MKRSERIAYITRVLSDSPRKVFSLKCFSEVLGASKSSISEDIDILRKSMQKTKRGRVETLVGASGGVYLIPGRPQEELLKELKSLEEILNEPERQILGEYLYYGDILYNPSWISLIAMCLHSLLGDAKIDAVLTVETKGVALALNMAKLFNVPTIVVRKTNRVSDGNTISVHYKSNSKNTLSSLYVSKDAIKKGSRVLIVDDYMKAGGTMEGLVSLVEECGAEVSGLGVFMRQKSNEIAKWDVKVLFDVSLGPEGRMVELDSISREFFSKKD